MWANLPGAHVRFLVLILFGNEGRDVGLEASGTDTHNDKTNGEDTHGDLGLDDNLRDS